MLCLKKKLGKWRAKNVELSSANKEYLKVIYLKKYGEVGILRRAVSGSERCIWSFSWSIFVCRRLIRYCLIGRVALKQQWLWKGNKKIWNMTRDIWIEIKISDNSFYRVMYPKLSVLGLNWIQYVQKKCGKSYHSLICEIKERPCHGLGVYFSQWRLIKIDGIMNAESTVSALIDHTVQPGKGLIGNGFLFQQHNDPKHTDNEAKDYLDIYNTSWTTIS